MKIFSAMLIYINLNFIREVSFNHLFQIGGKSSRRRVLKNHHKNNEIRANALMKGVRAPDTGFFSTVSAVVVVSFFPDIAASRGKKKKKTTVTYA